MLINTFYQQNRSRIFFNALQTGSGVHIKPTKTQLGNGLGTILASIGIPLTIEMVEKITGKGAPLLGKSTRSIPKTSQGGTGAPRLGIHQPPPPFIGTWEQMRGGGKKKKKKRTQS